MIRLAPGFGVTTGDACVWLVAGEDVRYRLDVADPTWLARVLGALLTPSTLEAAIARAPAAHRDDARELLADLMSERVLVEADAVAVASVVGMTSDIAVFRQDTLDLAALLAHNRAMIAGRRRWLWVTTGPAARAYVSPLFVPNAGPCAECLLVHFKRLSPVPDLYDALVADDPQRALAPAAMPAPALAIVDALVAWKCALTAEPVATPALYALHVLELRELTVTSHVPLADLECAACR